MPSRQQECHKKHQAIVQYLEKHDLDAVILTRRCNFAWYTCGGLNHVATCVDVGAISLLITREQALCITNNIEGPRINDETASALGIEVRSFAWHDADDATRTWTEAIGDCRIACDARIPGLPEQVASLSADFDDLRRTLSEEEIERLSNLAQETANCLESACRLARPDMTEDTLGSRIAALLLERGIRVPVLLIAADQRVRGYRHPLPASKKFTKYGMAVCCGERDGLLASVTRLFSFGPIADDLQRRHAATCTVDAALISATRPGKTLGDVFAVCQKAYADNGFADEWQYHHQGGSTGYLSREVKATPGNSTPVLTNQAFAWNPSIAGTKSEDTILVGPESNKILSITGNWPMSEYAADGQNWPRNDILVR